MRKIDFSYFTKNMRIRNNLKKIGWGIHSTEKLPFSKRYINWIFKLLENKEPPTLEVPYNML